MGAGQVCFAVRFFVHGGGSAGKSSGRELLWITRRLASWPERRALSKQRWRLVRHSLDSDRYAASGSSTRAEKSTFGVHSLCHLVGGARWGCWSACASLWRGAYGGLASCCLPVCKMFAHELTRPGQCQHQLPRLRVTEAGFRGTGCARAPAYSPLCIVEEAPPASGAGRVLGAGSWRADCQRCVIAPAIRNSPAAAAIVR